MHTYIHIHICVCIQWALARPKRNPSGSLQLMLAWCRAPMLPGIPRNQVWISGIGHRCKFWDAPVAASCTLTNVKKEKKKQDNHEKKKKKEKEKEEENQGEDE